MALRPCTQGDCGPLRRCGHRSQPLRLRMRKTNTSSRCALFSRTSPVSRMRLGMSISASGSVHSTTRIAPGCKRDRALRVPQRRQRTFEATQIHGIHELSPNLLYLCNKSRPAFRVLYWRFGSQSSQRQGASAIARPKLPPCICDAVTRPRPSPTISRGSPFRQISAATAFPGCGSSSGR
jgi:hypothetical protein